MTPDWSAFLSAAWPELAQGQKVTAPPSLTPPAEAGFVMPWIAESAGQHADWCSSLADGSRIHVHEYWPGPVWVVHRDVFDPTQGPARALGHFTTETRVGRALTLLGVGALVSAGVTRLGVGYHPSMLSLFLPGPL